MSNEQLAKKREKSDTHHTPHPKSHPPHPPSYIPPLASRISYLKSKIQNLKSKIDTLISFLIFFIALYAYTSTLAPTVIEGDAALFQYTPYVLGVTYPTGFPLYILLGKLWVTIFPFGEIAWRMNLFSALCSSVALVFIYNTARQVFAPKLAGARWAALATVLIFATLPTFWRWSTEAKTYGLNILLFSGMLYTAVHALTPSPSPGDRGAGGEGYPMALSFLLLGLFISVHNTAVLLLPGIAALAWLNFPRHRRWKTWLVYLICLALPGLFYLYIPLRAEWLIATYTRQNAIERGLLADFYTGWQGLIGYFAGVGFTEGVVSNWGLVPIQFFTIYVPLLIEDMTRYGVILSLIGGAALAVAQPRTFIPLFLMYAVPIPFVIVYGQGEQSAFLLPSFLMFSFFAGYTLIFITQLLIKFMPYAARHTQHASHIMYYALRITPPLLLFILALTFLRPQIQNNIAWLSIKWNRDIYNEWATALNHPLEPGAGMLAHWGDLTSFWYMQYADGRRPDLRGIYPPDEDIVINWFERGNPDLYIAGPLQGWAAGIEERYRLIPWGRLVRIAPKQVDPRSLLPSLPQTINTTFGDSLHLFNAEYASQAVAGKDYPITLTWQTLAELPPETTISVRLVQNGIIAAQLDERLRSGWFPRDSMPAGQHLLSYTLLPVPLGTLPGEYRLQLVAYTNVNQPWTLPDGTIILDLGPVEIVPFPANQQPDTTFYKPLPAHNFNNEIELAGYNYSVRRVGQGKGFAVRLLWQVKNQPAGNYTLRVEQLDANGNILRAVDHQSIDGRAPTSSWPSGHYIRDQVDLVVPASAPSGEDNLQVRLSWLRPDGSKLPLRRWSISVDDGLNLGWLTVTEKEGRMFDRPTVQHAVKANLENKVLLLGYNVLPPHNSPTEFGEIMQSKCAAGDESCQIDVAIFWQTMSEMDQPYRVFLHVVNAQDQIITQHDRVPGEDGRQPTTAWLPGEVVSDPIQLPLPTDIAPGQYTIRVGMYLPPAGPRLFVVNEAGEPIADYIEVGRLEIVEK